jgi:hypothetical protein
MLLAIAIAMPPAQSAGQQQTLTKKELKALIASAKTAADHELIAEYYHSEAKRLEAKQQEHEQELAEYYNDHSIYHPSKYPTWADHCRGLAAHYKIAAAKATAQADMHERLARDVR